MRALVTGASGFVGRHVVDALVAAGAEVRAFDRRPPDGGFPAEVEPVAGDVRDQAALMHAVEGCDAVFHLAAVYSYARRDAALVSEVNVEGTRAVLAAATRGGRRRIVHTSSCITCGPVPGRPATEADAPVRRAGRSAYRQSKLASERLALAAAAQGAEVVVVNPTAPVGAGDLRPTPTGRMVLDVARGRIHGYPARNALNIVAIEDVARGHLAALEHGRRGRRYLLGGENLSIRAVFAAIAAAAGVPAPRVPVPWTLAFAAAGITGPLLRALGREPELLELDAVRAARLPHLFDDAKARAELGYTSRPAAEALAVAARDALSRG